MSSPPVTAVERVTQLGALDLEDLCEAAEAAIEAGGGFGWIRAPRRNVFEAYWKGVLLVPERQLFVARLDGTIAGSAQLVRPPRANEAQSHQAQLTTCFVAPWARRRGLAKRMVLAAELAARAAGVLMINLDLRDSQVEARQLFEGLGYGKWGTHPAYARVDGRLVSGSYYCKLVDPEAAVAVGGMPELPAGGRA